MAPLDQLAVEGSFSADDMGDLVRARHPSRDRNTDGDSRTRSDAEVDYALARFVAANCAASGVFTDTPTPFVLKGGLAVYACFGGRRRSRDADVSPSSLNLGMDGLQPPDLLTAPRGMTILEPTQETEDGWRVPVEFTTTTGDDKAQIICDLNKPTRVIRRPPAIKRGFGSPFTTAPLPVWTVRAEEIVGEKISALLRRRSGRLRDIYDTAHLLELGDEIDFDPAEVREVTKEALQDLLPLPNLRETVREKILSRANAQDDLDWIAEEIRLIGHAAKIVDWQAQVGDVVPGVGTPREETDRLMELWRADDLLVR